MPEIKLTDVTKRWGKFYAVDHLDLDIEDNAFITLLGPSGCGKTTTLRMIAGLETPTEGRITIGDRVVYDSAKGINVPPNKRKVGFLFQNYALWPNMTVYQNISFGLSNIKEEMKSYDLEAAKLNAMIKALQNPADLVEIFEGCRDKTGKIVTDQMNLKLIDTYTMSLFTAKEFSAFGLQDSRNLAADVVGKKAELAGKLEKLKNGHKANGEELDDSFAIIKNGKPVTSVRKLSKEEVDLSVRRVSRIVKIGMFMDRYPAELSGGQQQRVAIARTLAPEPQVLFMDEPLSNLDAKLRLEMRYELQRLHLETGSTFVYVTHDQMEAMTLATKICLINNGVLQQYDAPLEVYNKPDNLFVADFVGNPSINFIEAKGKQSADGKIEMTILGDRKVTFTLNEPVDIEKWRADRKVITDKKISDAALQKNDKSYVEKENKDESFNYRINRVSACEDKEGDEFDLVIGVRPEFIRIKETGAFEGEVYGVMPTGMESTVKIAVDDYLLTGVIFGSILYNIGAKEQFDIEGNGILLFDRKTQQRIGIGSIM